MKFLTLFAFAAFVFSSESILIKKNHLRTTTGLARHNQEDSVDTELGSGEEHKHKHKQEEDVGEEEGEE